MNDFVTGRWSRTYVRGYSRCVCAAIVIYAIYTFGRGGKIGREARANSIQYFRAVCMCVERDRERKRDGEMDSEKDRAASGR